MLIGLHGKAGSGKDQSYQYIKEWAESEGRPVRRDAFADRLKLSAARALGFKGDLAQAVKFCNDLKERRLVGFATLTEADELAHPRAFITGREFLQYYGTEAHRQVFHEEFWTDAVLSEYDGKELLVVTDVRFPNEAVAIHKHGGQVWQIQRAQHVHIAEDAHPSELPLPSELIDHVIVNDSSLDHLRDLIQSQVERLVYG